MPKRRGIWEDGLDLNTLWADITNLCMQLGITVNFSQLRDPQYLNSILIQLSKDLRCFIDTVLDSMELKQRKCPVKRRRIIVVVSREPIVPADFEDFEYTTADSFPKLLILVVMIMNDVSIDMFGYTGDDTDDETVCLNESVDDESHNAEIVVERENNIANDSDDVGDIVEQLQHLRH